MHTEDAASDVSDVRSISNCNNSQAALATRAQMNHVEQRVLDFEQQNSQKMEKSIGSQAERQMPRRHWNQHRRAQNSRPCHIKSDARIMWSAMANEEEWLDVAIHAVHVTQFWQHC